MLLSRDPVSLPSAASSVVRVWEEYPIDEMVIVRARGVPEEWVETLVEWASVIIPKSRISRAEVDSSPEALVGSRKDLLLERLREIFRGGCQEGGVVLVSSGSRRMATASAYAGVLLGECNLDVVHVHFYFGPWRGLVYPYTPLRLHPLVEVNPALGPRPRGESAAGRYPEASQEWGPLIRITSGLPPLRSAVAELARRINRVAHSSFVLPSEGEPECGKIRLTIGDTPLPAAGVCDYRALARLAGNIAVHLNYLREKDIGTPVNNILAWTGLAHLEALVDHDKKPVPLPSLLTREKAIVDTTLIYHGAHRYYWEGSEVYVPECAIREIHRAVAEAVKRRALPSIRAAVGVMAYLALQDLLEAGAPIIPTAPGECDTSIPKIDPLLLEGKVLLSSDSGAIRYWRSHPSRSLVKGVVHVFFDPDKAEEQKVDPRRDPLSLPRLYYSLYQSIIALQLLHALRVSHDKVILEAQRPGGGEWVKVPIPSKTLLRAVGLD